MGRVRFWFWEKNFTAAGSDFLKYEANCLGAGIGRKWVFQEKKAAPRGTAGPLRTD